MLCRHFDVGVFNDICNIMHKKDLTPKKTIQKDQLTTEDIERGKRISLLMERVGFTQEAFGKAMEKKEQGKIVHKALSQSTIARYCTGEIDPRLKTLKRMSEIFNVPIEYISDGADLKNKEEYPNTQTPQPQIRNTPAQPTITVEPAKTGDNDQMADQKTIDRLFKQIEIMSAQNEQLSSKIDRFMSREDEYRLRERELQDEITRLRSELDSLKNTIPTHISANNKKVSNGDSLGE